MWPPSAWLYQPVMLLTSRSGMPNWILSLDRVIWSNSPRRNLRSPATSAPGITENALRIFASLRSTMSSSP